MCCQFNSQSVISKMLTIHAIPPASKLGPTVMVRVYILRISSRARKSGGSTQNLTLSQPRRISSESYHHHEPSLDETDKWRTIISGLFVSATIVTHNSTCTPSISLLYFSRDLATPHFSKFCGQNFKLQLLTHFLMVFLKTWTAHCPICNLDAWCTINANIDLFWIHVFGLQMWLLLVKQL